MVQLYCIYRLVDSQGRKEKLEIETETLPFSLDTFEVLQQTKNWEYEIPEST